MFFLISGQTVIYNVIGGVGTLVGPIVVPASSCAARAFSRLFTAKYLDPIGLHALAGMSYLVPLGLIFILMVIFMPLGLLGFARRWLNQ